MAAVGGLGLTAIAACRRDSEAEGSSATKSATPPAPLMPPAELNARLADVRSGRIAVLQVGPEYLWQKGHVPGSRWVGEAGTDAGIAALEHALKTIPAEVEIVAYCGCCPISHCPNIHPARRALAGRANATFLDLPTNLRTDWTDKGLPIEKA